MHLLDAMALPRQMMLPPVCGVYFLFLRDVLQYVGKSTSIESRIRQHLGSIEFDSYAFVVYSPGELAKMEAHYIRAYTPPMNTLIPGRKILQPLTKRRTSHLKTIKGIRGRP